MEEMEWLYIRYGELVYAYVYELCGDHFLAEDITQEVFAKVISKCCREQEFHPEHFFKKTRSVEEQFRQLAKQLLERTERYRSREVAAGEMNMLETVETTDYQPEQFSTDLDELREVIRQMGKLSPQVRQVICMKYYGKMQCREIARYLKQSENWVRHLTYSGKHMLADLIRAAL